VSVNVSLTIRINVTNESHPAAEVSVTLWEPAAVNVNPFQTIGNCAEQIVESIELLICGFILKLSVTNESHPAAEINVMLCDPAALNVNPFHMNGSCAAHTIESVDEVRAGFTIRLSVAMESHPAAEVKVALCDPAALNVNPFQIIGSWAEQTIESVDEVTAGFTIRLSVAMESHPADEINVTLWDPAALNVNPFHVNGSCAAQTIESVDEVTAGFTIRLSVAMESHPAAEVMVALWEPAAENVSPFHVNGS
jgi:ribosomal protein L31